MQKHRAECLHRDTSLRLVLSIKVLHGDVGQGVGRSLGNLRIFKVALSEDEIIVNDEGLMNVSPSSNTFINSIVKQWISLP